MLRTQGVPTRVATGYAAGTRDRIAGVYEVRASDAHAWVEVWFPETGWQAFDPTASVPFSLFSDALDGFGFIVSGAKNSSSIKVNGVETDVPGLSTKILNSTLYFEKYGWSARISNRYRGDFLGEIPLFDATLDYNNVSAESLVDAQIADFYCDGDNLVIFSKRFAPAEGHSAEAAIIR